MPLSAEDRLALHELLARYTHTLDYGDLGTMGDIWTEDCHFNADTPAVDIHGLTALTEFFQQTVAAVPNVRHVISNIFIEPCTEGAIIHAYVQITDFQENGIVAAGRYRDIAVNTEAGWKIQRRNFIAG